MVPPHFCQSEGRTGGEIKYIKNREASCLTKNQANHVYKKVEEGKIVTMNTLPQEVDQGIDREYNNPYKRVILNKVYKQNNQNPQAEDWSIFTDQIKYIQHDERSKYRFNLKPLNYQQHNDLYDQLNEEQCSSLNIDFGINVNSLKMKYLDSYEGVYADMVYTNRFDKNSTLSTTYLGQTKINRDTQFKAEERFPITGHGFTLGKLLDGTDCRILLDTGTTKSYMSKSFYMQCKCLHMLPKFSSHTYRIQVGNGQYVRVLFVIPVIIDIHGHRFQIYTLVSEIHKNVDLVLGMKNIFELEGVIDS